MSTQTLRLHQIIVPEHIHRITIDQDALQQLADSIKENGLINPITVVDNNDMTYTLRAGHRRLLAHQLLGRNIIEASVREGSVRDTEGITFAENLEREQLSPMEEAYAIKHEHEDNLVSVKQMAKRINRTEDWIRQRLALVHMPPDLCELVHTGKLAIGSAIALATVSDDAHRRYLQTYALDAGATVAVIGEWVRQWQLAVELGNGAAAPRPEMPEPGQPITVTMPCWVCAQPHPYEQLRVFRVCRDCTIELQEKAAATLEQTT